MRIIYEYVRSKKAEILRDMHNKELVKKEELSFENFCGALILPSKKDENMTFGLGGVVDQNGKYVQESGIPWRFGGGYECESNCFRDKKVVFCGYLVNHWGHFLIEAVARLWYFFENDSSVDKYVFVSDLDGDTEIFGNYKEFFELLGVYDRLEVINQPTKYREVVVPELGYKRGSYYGEGYKKIFDVIRERVLTGRESSFEIIEKVFLSRRFFAEKSEIGVDMLDNFFARNNYYVLHPEKVSLKEMIWLLDCAEVCAAESGTLPHNFLFCKDGKNTIIIERQDTINEIQIDIDKVRELQMTYIDGFYTIYPVPVSFGPYYLAYNTCMQKFSVDYGLNTPKPKYLTDRYIRKCVAKYMKIYRENYGYMWAIGKWQVAFAPLFYESYNDTWSDIGDYLSMKKPFKISQYFRVYYWKKVFGRIKRSLVRRARCI